MKKVLLKCFFLVFLSVFGGSFAYSDGYCDCDCILEAIDDPETEDLPDKLNLMLHYLENCV